MPSFALITEGITDQVLIERILQTRYSKDVVVNPLQPMRDATDVARQGEFGGWENVLAHCCAEEWANALSTNDYLIVQIDTDIAEHVNFGVALRIDGQDKDELQLIAEVRQRLIANINSAFLQAVEKQVIFAIAVHSAECWLLPLYSEPDKAQSKSCADRLQRARNKKGIAYAKQYQCYKDLCKPWKKAPALENCAKQHPSLQIFLKSLPPPDPS